MLTIKIKVFMLRRPKLTQRITLQLVVRGLKCPNLTFVFKNRYYTPEDLFLIYNMPLTSILTTKTSFQLIVHWSKCSDLKIDFKKGIYPLPPNN